MSENWYSHTEKEEIAALLLGRKVTEVSGDVLVLDNDMRLRFVGNGGCGGCPSGYYELKELNGIDNVITAVTFEDDPKGDSWAIDDEEEDLGEGVYRIFVYADNQKVNLATFQGTDGNGYYGSGYSIYINPEDEE